MSGVLKPRLSNEDIVGMFAGSSEVSLCWIDEPDSGIVMLNVATGHDGVDETVYTHGQNVIK